jgi:hypothetical protein
LYAQRAAAAGLRQAVTCALLRASAVSYTRVTSTGSILPLYLTPCQFCFYEAIQHVHHGVFWPRGKEFAALQGLPPDRHVGGLQS